MSKSLSAMKRLVETMPPVEKEKKKKIKRSKKEEESHSSLKKAETPTTTTIPLSVVEEPLPLVTTDTFLPSLDFEHEQAMVNLLDEMISGPPNTAVTTHITPPPIIPAPRLTFSEVKQYDINVCPFHQVNLSTFEARSNKKTYVKCQLVPCGLFVGIDEIIPYMNIIHTKIHAVYKKLQGAIKCECNNQASLRVSKSASNFERPYFACRDNDGCRFFQWADVPFTIRTQRLQEKFNQV